jgi:ribosomal protein S27E
MEVKCDECRETNFISIVDIQLFRDKEVDSAYLFIECEYCDNLIYDQQKDFKNDKKKG